MTYNVFTQRQHDKIRRLIGVTVEPARRPFATALLEERFRYDVMLFGIDGPESTEARPLYDDVVDARVAIVDVDVSHLDSIRYLRLFVKSCSTRFCAISLFGLRCGNERPGIGLFSPLSALPMFSVISLIFMCAPAVFSRLRQHTIDITSHFMLHFNDRGTT